MLCFVHFKIYAHIIRYACIFVLSAQCILAYTPTYIYALGLMMFYAYKNKYDAYLFRYACIVFPTSGGRPVFAAKPPHRAVFCIRS